MIIQILTSDYLEEMIHLQTIAIANGDPFTPSSKDFYLRAFMFQNFVYGVIENNELIGYCNCSIPTNRAATNLGRGIVSADELDSVGHVNTILIDSKYRRMGYGGRLLLRVIEHFEIHSHVKYVFTTIQTVNVPSYNLFLKNNFQELKIFENRGTQKYLLERRLS